MLSDHPFKKIFRKILAFKFRRHTLSLGVPGVPTKENLWQMNFCAHTAQDGQGRQLPENSGQWKPLSVELRNVAGLARKPDENKEAPRGLSARGRDKKAQRSALLKDRHEFYPNATSQRSGDTRMDL
jgi:hypothetical protein